VSYLNKPLKGANKLKISRNDLCPNCGQHIIGAVTYHIRTLKHKAAVMRETTAKLEAQKKIRKTTLERSKP
jgi:hypothetical protein